MLYKYKYTNDGKTRTYCRCLGIDNKEYIIRMDALTTGKTKTISGVGHKQIKKDLIGNNYGMLTVINDTGYRNDSGHVIWHCKCDCGNECDVISSNLISHHTLSCGCNNKSKWEDLIYNYLQSNNIKFEYQKRFEDCKNLQNSDSLPFDFYLSDLNKIIEYDGLQHYQPIPYWGGEEKFETTKQNDSIKNKYCEDNNIRLLRIPWYYKEAEVIESLNLFITP